jgi:uncharacterized integral membrane protein
MRIFWVVLGLIIFIAVAGFALLNAKLVPIDYYVGQREVPLALIIVIAFLIGGLLGWVWGYGKGRFVRSVLPKKP